MPRYSRKARGEVKKAMHEKKHGTLHSGKSKKPVKSRKQAIAIGLSEARKKGAKAPPEVVLIFRADNSSSAVATAFQSGRPAL